MENKAQKAALVILAGGKSSRFGKDKSLLKIDNTLLVEMLIRRFEGLFAQVFIVSQKGNKFSLPGVEEIADQYPGQGPLAGLHAGLKAAATPWIMALACDMPLVNRALAENMLAALHEDIWALIPRHEGRPEPLCAFYHRHCLPVIEEILGDKTARRSMRQLHEKIPMAYIETENCFLNLNAPEDLAKLIEEKDS